MNPFLRPAFPTLQCDEASLSKGGSYTADEGLTVIELLAGLIAGGMVVGDTNTSITPDMIADSAIAHAQAIIRKTRPGGFPKAEQELPTPEELAAEGDPDDF